jgi:hypothetical protein
MELIAIKIAPKKRLFLHREKYLFFLLFFFNLGFAKINNLSNDNSALTNNENVKVQLNRDTLLIFTKDMVIVSQIDKEKSKLFQNDKHLHEKIQTVYSKKNDQSKYLVLYADVKHNLNVVNELGNNVSVAEIIHNHRNQTETNINKIILFVIILLPLLLLGYYIRKGKNTSQKHYANILENLQTSADKPSLLLDTEIPQHSTCEEHKTKPLNINDETIKHILARLAKFEKSQKYLRQDMSLSGLASYLDTNTKYLSEILKQYKGKKFSDYINGLRIMHITEVLYKNPIYREYKISYLAESCGFASREVFAVVFKKETGISPSYFINNLRNGEDNSPPASMLAIQ